MAEYPSHCVRNMHAVRTQCEILDLEFEVVAHDGAYNGPLHSHVPFIGRKFVRHKSLNDICVRCGARVEYWSTCLWAQRVVCNIWLGSREDLQANTHMVLHFTQFMVRRQSGINLTAPK